MGRNCAIAFVIATLLTAACRQPHSYEQFVTMASSQGGIYEFQLDLSDSLSVYDIWLYNRVESPLGRRVAQKRIPLSVVWTAPDSTCFVENVYMLAGGRRGERELYRSGIIPNVLGRYLLQIRPSEVPQGFDGIGIICVREPLDGGH